MKRQALLIFMAIGSTALSQTPSPGGTPSPTPGATPSDRIWRCDLPGGTYEVAVAAIISVSRHEYVVDAVARVIEMNIDTQGNMAARFYYIEPNTPRAPAGIGQSALDRVSELAKEAAQKTNADDVWKHVVKSYPTTTHAHTIEYRVASEDQLKRIFASVQEAFESGRGGAFSSSDTSKK